MAPQPDDPLHLILKDLGPSPSVESLIGNGHPIRMSQLPIRGSHCPISGSQRPISGSQLDILLLISCFVHVFSPQLECNSTHS